MDAIPIIIAVYAALVATGSLCWQIYTWRHRRQNRVEVSVRLAVASSASGQTIQALLVSATNRSEHPLRVSGVGLDLHRDDNYQFHQVKSLYGATLPGVVDPNDAGTALIMRDEAEAEGLDISKPVKAWVRLATGELVYSEPTQILRSE
jgi:hypothetical protein